MSGMISFESKGSFKNTEAYLYSARKRDISSLLDAYGRQGVAALSAVTPVDSGETAASWYYEIVNKHGYHSIIFRNSHVENGIPIAILLQYGHATRNGGFVQGRDYINPAIRPLFDRLASEVWREVTKA